MAFDENLRVVQAGDAFPHWIRMAFKEYLRVVQAGDTFTDWIGMAFEEYSRMVQAGDACTHWIVMAFEEYLRVVQARDTFTDWIRQQGLELERKLEWKKMCLEFERCFNEDISKAVEFSVASSEKWGIDIKFGFDTLHVPKHCSVRHPVIQMMLFATVLQNTFYSPRSIVRKAILDTIKKSSSDACTTTFSEADWVLPRSRSTNSHIGGAISDETQISRTRGPVNSVWAREPKDQHYILMNPGNEQNDLPCELDQPIHCSKHPDANEILIGDTKPPHLRVGEGTPLNSSGCGGKRHDSIVHVLAAPQSLPPSDGGSSSTGTPAPCLWLDSGAAHHVVGDAGILTDLRDPPAGTVVRVADGFPLDVTKVGDIQASHIKISDVYLVPGLKMNLVSVRQLAKSKISTTFYENHAELWLEGEQIGGAIVDDDVGLYRLHHLEPPMHE